MEESNLKSTETATPSEEPKKKGRLRGLWQSLFVNKVIDLLIVIVGISIAFQLNSLKQDNDRKSLERFYLESMLTDLDNDIIEYEDNLGELISDRIMVISCLSNIEQGRNVSDSLGGVVANLISMKTFEGHRNTYAMIINANGLSVIENRDIRGQILEHYRLYAALERFESNYLMISSRIFDHFNSQIDYNQPGKPINKGVVDDLKTKNLLVSCAAQLQGGIWRYEESLEKAKTLRSGIRDYLK